MNGYSNLVVGIRDEILWLRISRPASRNALSRATLAEIGHACSTHAEHPELKAAVIIGEGHEAFAAGGDLRELATVRSERDAGEFFDEACRAVDEVRSFPLPTVAALNGMALGGGAELALACDFRVAAPHASIGYVQARLAISCGFGGAADLMDVLGPAAAMRHGLRGETLEAARALEVGLVDHVAASGVALEAAVEDFLRPLVRQKVQVLRAYKAFAMACRSGNTPVQRRKLEREWFVRTWTHPDHWQAVEAVMSKWQEKSA